MSYLMQFHEVNICQIMIFRLYTFYNEHEMTKIVNQTRENSQVLSQVLEYFLLSTVLNYYDSSGIEIAFLFLAEELHYSALTTRPLKPYSIFLDKRLMKDREKKRSFILLKSMYVA